MIEKDLVSIIIPVYNRQQVVLKTLHNIWQNKYRPIELILINDGSDDDSLNILHKFKRDHENHDFKVLVFDQKNSGAPVARNLGFRKSKGLFIQFLDSDDFIDTEKFTIQIEKMKQEDADFGLCDYSMLYENNTKTVYHSNSKKINKILKTHGSFGCGSPLLRRELTDKVLWAEELTQKQDVDYFLKAALLSKNMAYVEKSLYTYIRNIDDIYRISATYKTTAIIYKIRIQSLKKITVPKHHKIHKRIAIWHLYYSILKLKVKKNYEKINF